MKPFTWEKYDASVKAGKPLRVVTRDGREPNQIVKMEGTSQVWRVMGVVEGVIYSWREDGGSAVIDSPLDLFFAPKTRKVWVMIVQNSAGWPVAQSATTEVNYESLRRHFLNDGWTILDEFVREVEEK